MFFDKILMPNFLRLTLKFPLLVGLGYTTASPQLLFTVTVKFIEFAHWFTSGVNVYVVVAVLLIAGVQDPVILLFEIVGKLNVSPEQIELANEKDGINLEFTLTVMVVVFAHWFASGVNVYVVVTVLFIAGVQTPVMLLFEVVGNVKEPP